MATSVSAPVITTDIPARMDRLPWSTWHWRIVIALGITWVLDGLEVTIVGALGGVLTEPGTLHLSESQVGLAGSLYVAGAVLGALMFGYLTDQLGRKRLFMITLAVYLTATLLTAFAPNFAWFAVCRFFTGTGIGGEYSAINPAIDELIPARVRGWTDLAINGSYWIGTIVGAAATLVLLNPSILPHDIGWRLCFGLGAVLALAIILVRRYIPESPRWLLIHDRAHEAEQIVRRIEEEVRRATRLAQLPAPDKSIAITPRGAIGFGEIARVMLAQYRQRSLLGLSLMMGQAFLYNAIFFTYALVLTTFYRVDNSKVGLYLIPFAIGNVLGPLTIGRLFDTLGRRPDRGYVGCRDGAPQPGGHRHTSVDRLIPTRTEWRWHGRVVTLPAIVQPRERARTEGGIGEGLTRAWLRRLEPWPTDVRSPPVTAPASPQPTGRRTSRRP